MPQSKNKPPRPSGGGIAALDPRLFPGTIEHLLDCRVLFCHVHKQPVPLKQLDQHLYKTHGLAIAFRRPVVEHCQTLDVVQVPNEIGPRPDYSPVIPALPVYDKAYSCNRCRFLTSSEKPMRRHLNTDHSIYYSACKENFVRVAVQSWYNDGRSQYWVVNTLDTLGEDGKPGTRISRSLPEPEAALEKMEKEEIERLRSQEEDHESWDAEVEHAESSLWLQYMKWPAQFANRPLEIIAAAARKPALEPFEGYGLGIWNGSL
ncbi:hypothetical protein V500_03936 [Pseudogymnoascus sp. VKM F-4518 (FW-2643)]|nr:hypothetical protein V500_03936 [Pseudogymnoascus sp. VKM F-4518 (FW-2643)]